MRYVPDFRPISGDAQGVHLFEVLSCEAASDDALVDDLAAELRALYADVEDLADRLRKQAEELGAVADEDRIKEVVDRVLAASIPEPGQHKVAHLDVARNELAELLAHLVVQARYGTLVPASRVRHKEIPGAPARGLDLLGLEFDPLRGIVTEVKASDQAASPPAVVESGNDSLRGQFVSFLAKSDRMLAELNRLYKQAAPDDLDSIAEAMASQVDGTLDLVVNPVLVRPSSRHEADDFGSFRSDPDQFDSRPIRFCLVSIDQSLEDLSRAVYDQARS
jgi:hypothetical protein